MTHRTGLSVLSNVLAALAALAALAVAALPATASAQTGGAAPQGTASASQPAADEDVEEGAGTPRDAAYDQRTMHLLFHGKAGAAFPAGSIASELPTSSVAGTGIGFGGSLGLGLSRYLVLQGSGSYALLSSHAGCDSCSTRVFDIGLGFSYHLAQGIAFDPWISYEFGFRRATYSAQMGVAQDGSPEYEERWFQGLDLVRLGIGGDFYPVPAFGFGPYFEMDLGTSITWSDPDRSSSVYAFFQLGLQIALDPVRKVPPPSRGRGGGRVGKHLAVPAPHIE